MTEELDLLLVNLGSREQVYGELGSSLSAIEPPLWCGLIAGYIREHGYLVGVKLPETGHVIPNIQRIHYRCQQNIYQQ